MIIVASAPSLVVGAEQTRVGAKGGLRECKK